MRRKGKDEMLLEVGCGNDGEVGNAIAVEVTFGLSLVPS